MAAYAIYTISRHCSHQKVHNYCNLILLLVPLTTLLRLIQLLLSVSCQSICSYSFWAKSALMWWTGTWQVDEIHCRCNRIGHSCCSYFPLPHQPFLNLTQHINFHIQNHVGLCAKRNVEHDFVWLSFLWAFILKASSQQFITLHCNSSVENGITVLLHTHSKMWTNTELLILSACIKEYTIMPLLLEICGF